MIRKRKIKIVPTLPLLLKEFSCFSHILWVVLFFLFFFFGPVLFCLCEL